MAATHYALWVTVIGSLWVSTAFAAEDPPQSEPEENSEGAPPAEEAPPAPAAPPPAPPPPAPKAPEAPADPEPPVTPSAPPGGTDREIINITGSRLKQNALASPAPVSVLSREDLKLSGMVSIGEILQNLTAHGNGINVNFNNGGDGSTRVNLRSVGSNRTLVLVNGRRWVAGGSGANSSVDLNAIPAAIIERVEVLKDGASAVYGSDAIAGVVNIITRRDFEGVEIGGFVGGSGQGDGVLYDLTATAGVTTRKGSFLVSVGVYEQKPIFAGDRKFSRQDKNYNFDPDYDPDTDGERVTDAGSSATPEGALIDRGEDEGGNEAWRAAQERCDSGFCFNDPDGGWRNFAPTGNRDVGTGDFYNYQPENYLVTPQQRYSFFVSGDYELADWARVYVEGSYTRRMSNQLLAPTPLFTISEGITVSADNVHNPFGRDFIDVRRRFTEAGNRVFRQEVDTFRVVTGIDGDLPDVGPLTAWRWDLHFNYGRTSGTDVNEGQFIRSRVIQALGPADQCTGDCVALNLFGGEGTITDEMVDYLSYTGIASGFSDQMILSMSTGANLAEFYPDHFLGLGLGYEYRRENGAFTPDPITSSGDTTGNKGEPTAGGFNVNSAYTELRIPILADLAAVELLELSAAARFFSYNTFGSDFTYKLGLRWQVTDYLAIRGTHSTAYRAPSISELFSGQFDSFPGATDPCRTFDANDDGTVDPDEGRKSANVIANCTADGVPTTLTDPSTQLRTRLGGNPELQPETANTLTVGLVLEPTLIKGLSFTFDFWNLSIKDSIQPRGTGVILSQCYENNPGDRQYCDAIERDANNLITNVFDAESNAGGVDTTGIDIALRFRDTFAFGDLGLNFELTWLLDYTETLADGFKLQGKGVYDLGGVYPDIKFNAGVVWGLEGWLAGLNLRYIDGFKECDSTVLCNGRHDEGTEVVSRDVDSNINVDLYGSYAFETKMGSTEIGFGINNLFDQDPPPVYNGFLANSDGAAYDFIGRYFYTRLTHHFR